MAFKSPASLLAPPESLEQQLVTHQKRVYLAWGVLITFATISATEGTSYMNFGAALLLLVLLIVPALIGLVLLKLPKWQTMPLVTRKNTILSAFGVSWLTSALIPLAVSLDGYGITHPFVPVAFLYGLGYGWLVLHLERKAYEEPDEMFP